MATAKLRETFRYPADNSDEDEEPGDLDEEEQEKLIERLKKEDEDRNELYKCILLILPIVAALSFLPTLTSGVYQARLSSLLSITSLLSTAYTLYFVPTTRSTNNPKQTLLTRPRTGPLKRYIEPANGILSALLGFNAAIYKNRPGVHQQFWLLSLLPLSSFIVIMLARRLMVEVDIGELERLKYGYKGA